MGAPIPFAGCLTEPRSDIKLALIGVADDTQSTFLPGPAEAPARVRAAYDGLCFNSTTESGVDLEGQVADHGDLHPLSDWSASARRYEERIRELVRGGATPFIVGGDHAITIPVVQALSEIGEKVHVVQIDAHPDIYPDFEGNPNSHACTGARVLEMDHVASLTQLGIRTLNAAQHGIVERHAGRLHILTARDTASDELPHPPHVPADGPVYLTLDIDGIDPAFAPGVSHPVPGGLSSRQVLTFIQTFACRLVGMDVVEINPSRDVNDQTSILGARLLHEGMGRAVRSGR